MSDAKRRPAAPPTPALPALQRGPARDEARGIVTAAATLAGPLLGGMMIRRELRRRERRDRVLALLDPFLAEPMATTRRTAWAFLHAEGDDVRHFSHYVLHDPNYGREDSGFACLLKVLLWQRTVDDLRQLGELDPKLDAKLLELHRAAWSDYTARMAARSASHPEAVERNDSKLFTWRLTDG